MSDLEEKNHGHMIPHLQSCLNSKTNIFIYTFACEPPKRMGLVTGLRRDSGSRGIDWSAPGTTAWSAQLSRHQSCQITLRGDAELDAEGVTLKGDVRYDVPRGWRLSLRPGADGDGGAGVEESWTHLPTAAAGGGSGVGGVGGLGGTNGFTGSGLKGILLTLLIIWQDGTKRLVGSMGHWSK